MIQRIRTLENTITFLSIFFVLFTLLWLFVGFQGMVLGFGYFTDGADFYCNFKNRFWKKCFTLIGYYYMYGEKLDDTVNNALFGTSLVIILSAILCLASVYVKFVSFRLLNLFILIFFFFGFFIASIYCHSKDSDELDLMVYGYLTTLILACLIGLSVCLLWATKELQQLEELAIRKEMERIKKERIKQEIHDINIANYLKAQRIQKDLRLAQFERDEYIRYEAERIASIKEAERYASIREADRYASIREADRIASLREADRIASLRDEDRIASIKDTDARERKSLRSPAPVEQPRYTEVIHQY